MKQAISFVCFIKRNKQINVFISHIFACKFKIKTAVVICASAKYKHHSDQHSYHNEIFNVLFHTITALCVYFTQFSCNRQLKYYHK